jgi:hypothetical protein
MAARKSFCRRLSKEEVAPQGLLSTASTHSTDEVMTAALQVMLLEKNELVILSK